MCFRACFLAGRAKDLSAPGGMFKSVYFLKQTAQYLILLLHVPAAEGCHVQGDTVFQYIRKVLC